MKFIYSKTKERFKEKLLEDLIKEEDIVFIEETKEIWTHSLLYATSVDLSDKLSFLLLTLGEYSALTEYKDDTIYIVEHTFKDGKLYKFVDLGLPSGTLWCDRNIGADSPEDTGLYFLWGDVKGYTAEQLGESEGKKMFASDYSDYVWYDTETGAFTKYIGTGNGTELELEADDDAAVQILGGDAHMPTREQMMELVQNTTPTLVMPDGVEINGTWSETNGHVEWETIDDSKYPIVQDGICAIKGVKFTNKNDASKYVFVPAAGLLSLGSAQVVGLGGFLLSSSRFGDGENRAFGLGFSSYDASVYGNYRHLGDPVRGVTSTLINDKIYFKGELLNNSEEILELKLSLDNLKLDIESILSDLYRIVDYKPYDVEIPESLIALYDSTEAKELVINSLDYNAEDYPVDRYTPIGVVVIPADHSKVLYPEGHVCHGKPIIMSLKYMRYDTPDTGGEAQSMYWGGYGKDLTLPNYTKSAVVANSEAEEESTESSSYYSDLPSTKFSGVESKAAPKTKYNGSTPYCPSPYLWKDGKWNPNPAFYNCPATCAQTDRDGKGNSEVILAQATAQADWKTASAITNNSGNGYYPAACCCYRYHNEGIDHQGDWYLPACGELCYIMPFFNEHNNAMTKINSVVSSADVLLNTNGSHWSSSEYASLGARYVYSYSGRVGYGDKNFTTFVRAFRPVKI